MISLIAAMGKNRELGLNNQLLWKLPEDMKFFRKTTMGKPILVGRKTYESFGGKPLPGRKNIVITTNADYHSDGATIVHSLDAALQEAGAVEEIMVIGGASFYEQTLSQANRLYLTYVDANFEADSWFPEIDLNQWQQISSISHQKDVKNPYNYTFAVYDRIAS